MDASLQKMGEDKLRESGGFREEEWVNTVQPLLEACTRASGMLPIEHRQTAL